MKTQFIPQSFTVPHALKTDSFYFRVLEDSLAAFDYEAVMTSLEKLTSIFGPDTTWPNKNMTLNDNIASLKVHKQEFKSREAFAYSVFNQTNDRCLGCVYIDPSQSSHYDCEVYLWVRSDSAMLDQQLYTVVLDWLKQDWPFTNIAFPGREITWHEWTEQLNRN
ncbi:hypothetical protein [Colwellia psychrerythraea]|uniref:GNAT family N-acetyltransferase n=1 Tax=Colwellia psychrerythraea TaxID=28229 RepID=A0A099KHK9_COLPS|nr:hypothetical protein [Colwellia psychrerythraea]KGJ89846.1 hypothetical protein GAB14E_3724 [Colwellia psychrerythraea]